VAPLRSDDGLESLVVGDLGEFSVQGRGGGSTVANVGSGFASAVRQLSQVRFPDFPLPWEDNSLMSPSSRDQEVSVSGVADSIDLPRLVETLAKASSQAKSTRNSSLAKSLIRRRFLGPRVAPPMVLDDIISTPASDLIRWDSLGLCPAPPTLPVVKGATFLFDGAADLGRSLSQLGASTSSVSKSQLGHFRRVKEKVAKQLIKNKEMLAEVVAVNPREGVEGYSKEVHNVMNAAFVVGMTWGGNDNKMLDLLSARERKAKGMRELKNLDYSISPVKCQRRRGELGLKRIFPFPLKFNRGVGLRGVLFWWVLFWEPFCIYCWVFPLGC
jgi:hypothetical protein